MCFAQGPQRSDAGEARTPQQSACWKTLSSYLSALGMSLLQTKSLPVAVCFPTGRLILWGSVSSRYVLMHGVKASLCHLHLFGLETSRCLKRSSHHSALGMLLPETKSLPVAVCFPTGRLILRGSVSPRSVLMHWVEASPCHLHCLGSKHPDVYLHRERRSP